MGYALKIYEAFREYGEEKARILAEAFEELEKRYPQILDMATRKDLSETELKLTKEIEQVRLELTKEIEGVRLEVEEVRKELKETELKLTKEIEQVRLELTKEIEQVKFSTIKWIVALIGGQTVVLISSFFAILRHFLSS
jgi:predicted PP-loop superfamily ATPase